MNRRRRPAIPTAANPIRATTAGDFAGRSRKIVLDSTALPWYRCATLHNWVLNRRPGNLPTGPREARPDDRLRKLSGTMCLRMPETIPGLVRALPALARDDG